MGLLTTLLTTSATNQALNTTSNPTFANLTATGTLAVTGIYTPTGGIAAAGGFAVAPRNIHTGGISVTQTTDGNDTTPATTETYIAEVFVPCNMTITGIALFNGSATGSGDVTVALANSSGAVVGTQSASTAVSGTDAFQRVPLGATYAAVGPAVYYVLVQYNNTATRFNTHLLGNFGASKKTAETYGTFTTITPPTTFTANQGPIASLY